MSCDVSEQVYPQDDNNQLLTWKPQTGARVHVTVGHAVDASTLLAELNQRWGRGASIVKFVLCVCCEGRCVVRVLLRAVCCACVVKGGVSCVCC